MAFQAATSSNPGFNPPPRPSTNFLTAGGGRFAVPSSHPPNPNSFSTPFFSNAANQASGASGVRNSPSAAPQAARPVAAKAAPEFLFRHTDQTLAARPKESDPSSAKLRRNLSSAPDFGESSFTVLVGQEDNIKRFSLHKSLAVRESAFFDKAFSNEWKESEENEIRLPDHDPEHFQIFIRWLYTRHIFTSPALYFGGEGSDEWDLLANAWALGAYLQATDFQDTIADAMLEKAAQGSISTQSVHQTIYANSVAGTPIRKLVVDMAVRRWDVTMLEAQSNNATWSDFFRDLSIALLKIRSSPREESTVVNKNCNYHEHRLEGGACYTTKQHGFS